MLLLLHCHLLLLHGQLLLLLHLLNLLWGHLLGHLCHLLLMLLRRNPWW